ncbi:LysR family transcriptional regulator [Zobellella denitrificans]|uniref:LysR family transcriptional regulator n=1 Tax=Zobellella denitrificans TaxID=347534 RepID=UPI000B8C05EC|nr:LysR family transcriptional regulator [Zobellella denitrificans]OXS15923.1 LysR family transcriptional regulator [Zobellella denitrificans]
MDVSYRQLRAFLALVEERNITRAAERIHLTQSALSQMLKRLEQQLEAELLRREGRELGLTPAGEALYREARVIVNRLDKLLRDNRDRRHGFHKSLVVSSLYTLSASLAPRALNRMKQEHRDFTFRLIEERVDDITRSVLEGRADVGINTPDHHPDLDFIPLFRDYLCLACRDDHPLAGADAVSWEQAYEHAGIGVSPGNSLRTLADEAFHRIGLSYDPEFNASHTSTLLGMISSGLGSAILSSTISAIDNTPGIRFLPIRSPYQYRQVGLLLRKDARRPLIDEFCLRIQEQVADWQAVKEGQVLLPGRPGAAG